MTNQSIVAGKRSARAILATAMAVLLIVSIFASTALAETVHQYDVTIIDNAEEFTIATTETEPIEILKAAGIALNSDDKMDITSFEEGEGGVIKINRFNTVNVKFDGNVQTYQVYGATVGEALAEIGVTVNEKDEINYSLDAPVKDGMVVDIKSAFSVQLSADGETAKYAIVRGTVADLLSLAGVTLGADDYTKPAESGYEGQGVPRGIQRGNPHGNHQVFHHENQGQNPESGHHKNRYQGRERQQGRHLPREIRERQGGQQSDAHRKGSHTADGQSCQGGHQEGCRLRQAERRAVQKRLLRWSENQRTLHALLRMRYL